MWHHQSIVVADGVRGSKVEQGGAILNFISLRQYSLAATLLLGCKWIALEAREEGTTIP